MKAAKLPVFTLFYNQEHMSIGRKLFIRYGFSGSRGFCRQARCKPLHESADGKLTHMGNQ